MPDQKHTIHIVDDDEAVRSAVGFLFRTAGYLVKTYASGVEFLKVSSDVQPGCILLDVLMPGLGGIEVQQELRARGVTMPVIVMTGHGEIEIAVSAMKADAVDFIEKPFDKAVLFSAVEEAFFRIEDADRRRLRADEAKTRLQALTPRERDVLQGLVRGHANKTIAYHLHISPRTVEVHRANLMSAVGVPSLSAVLRIAFAAGLDEVEEMHSPLTVE